MRFAVCWYTGSVSIGTPDHWSQHPPRKGQNCQPARRVVNLLRSWGLPEYRGTHGITFHYGFPAPKGLFAMENKVNA
jgi:hypothetical protein